LSTCALRRLPDQEWQRDEGTSFISKLRMNVLY
jgi:hypothetical protein